MGSPDSNALQQALDRLWFQFLPQIEERLVSLEAAAQALGRGTLHEDQRHQAHEAAHKLAGTLGTFGLTKGTILAREAEIAYSAEIDPAPSVAAHLQEITEQLKVMIAAHKQG